MPYIYGFIMRRKTLVHVLSLTMNIFDKNKCKKHLFEASKVVDEPLSYKLGFV